MTKPIPEPFRSITPHLTIKDADKAIDFYQKIFGGQIINQMFWPNGKIMHAKVKIGDSIFMLHEETAGADKGDPAPTTIGGSPVSLHVFVDDVDATFNRAVEAGAKAVFPPTNMFWGDRWGRLVDPFGHRWDLATHVEDVAPADVEKRQKDFCNQMATVKK